MASWMVHLRVADILLSKIDGLQEKDFLVGNIAPDGGEPNKDWTVFTPNKTVSHFQTPQSGKYADAEHFYRQYLKEKNYPIEKYSFYLGYYCHLVTDLLWHQEIYYSTKAKYSKEFLEDKNFIWKVKKDWYDLDHLFLKTHPAFHGYRTFEQAKGYLNEHLDFFSKEAFANRIEYITNFYNGSHEDLDRAYTYLTQKQMDAFVTYAAQIILGRLGHEWADIPDSNTWKTIELITKGWSNEKKYYIETFTGDKYLLRLTEISQYERKKKEYELLKDLNDISFTRPLCFGTCSNNSLVFTLYTWVEGQDLEDVLPALSENLQYQLGYQSGMILNRFHQIPAAADSKPWNVRFNNKIDRKIKQYQECAIKVEGTENIVQYLNDNRHLLTARPQSFQHGDYHVGNMVIDDNYRLGIVDFNRYDFGDPWEEFNRIVWCAQVSPAFATGQLDGYFNNTIPDKFWRLLALYIGSNQLSAIPWAIAFGEDEIKTMISQTKQVLHWYDDYTTYIPSWYDEHLKHFYRA